MPKWRATRLGPQIIVGVPHEILRNHQPGEAQKLLLQAGGLVRSNNRPTRMEIALDLGDARLALSDLEGALDSYQEGVAHRMAATSAYQGGRCPG